MRTDANDDYITGIIMFGTSEEKREEEFFKYAASHVGDCSDFGVVDFYFALSFRQVPK